MIIDFSQHTQPQINFAHVYQAGEIDLEDEIAQVTGPMEVKGNARRINSSSNSATATVKGNLSGRIELACSRCLQPVETNFETTFDVDYVTLGEYEQVGGETNAEHGLTNADFSVSVYDGERIDLDELTREQILLNLPARQLCQENCAGLCEKCGTNKNINHCSCETEEIDPRWNALKEFKSNN